MLSYFGVDASDYSFAYVAHWAEQKEVVKSVLSSIQKTARAIIEAVEDGASEAERPTLEVEAEGTAYAVLSYFGVDTSSYSFAYVAHWAEQKKVVKAVLTSVQKTARAIIEAVDDGRSQAERRFDRGAA